MELTTLARAKDYLGVTSSTYDTVITSIIEGAESQLRSWCGRANGWTKAAQTEYFDQDNQSRFVLAYTPVDSTVSVVITINGTTLDSGAYTTDYTKGIVGLISSFWGWTSSYRWGRNTNSILANRMPYQGVNPDFKAISIAYTGGYTAPVYTSAPSLEQAVWMLISYQWGMRGKLGMTSETLGSYSYTRDPQGYEELRLQILSMLGLENNNTGV